MNFNKQIRSLNQFSYCHFTSSLAKQIRFPNQLAASDFKTGLVIRSLSKSCEIDDGYPEIMQEVAAIAFGSAYALTPSGQSSC